LPILLFVLYSLLCAYGIWRLPFFRNSGIRPGVLLLLFALHVLTGCLHTVIAWRYYPLHGDIWAYYENGLDLIHKLHTDFHAFLDDNSTLDSFTHNSLAFIHMFLDLFSLQNIYINTLLFSFPVFLGNTALFRVFRRHFPENPLPALGVYLLPSALFYTSCIHREGALYLLLGFFLYGLDNRRTWLTLCCYLFIVYFRFVVALTLLPALLIWRWPSIPPRKALIAGSAVLLLAILLAGPAALSILTRQQHYFQALEGHSRIYLPLLDGSLGNFLHTLPVALFNGWLQPLPGVGGQKIYLLFSLELLAIWIIVCYAAIRRLATRNSTQRLIVNGPSRFSTGCVVFALFAMLLIGLVIPFVGAIVRYRSIYLPFLLAPSLNYLCTLSFFQRSNRRISRWIFTNYKLLI
jgi:hypothetical protein